jgi:glycosyltransferase involved in cell wall biosynthesis
MDFIRAGRFVLRYSPSRVGNFLKDAYSWYDITVKQRCVAPRIRHLHGPQEISTSKADFVVLCLVRDAGIYLRFFIEHYFRLGAKHIVFLDNGSRDQTVEIAREYSNVTILETDLSFSRFQSNMRRYLLDRYGKNRWALLADIDEFFDYPCSDRISMKQFLEYLERHSYTAVVTQVLDMFSDVPIEEVQLESGKRLQDFYPFYDIAEVTRHPYPTRLNRVSNPHLQIYRRGLRWAAFGVDCDLTHHAPVFWKDVHYLNPHYVRGSVLADISCVTYHFKFLPGFEKRVREAVRLENHWSHSVEYKLYLRRLCAEPTFVLKRKTSAKLTSLEELWHNNFLVVSQEYLNFVDEYSPKAALKTDLEQEGFRRVRGEFLPLGNHRVKS